MSRSISESQISDIWKAIFEQDKAAARRLLAAFHQVSPEDLMSLTDRLDRKPISKFRGGVNG